MLDWNKYPNFKETEFQCKHCGQVDMQASFMERLQTLRTAYGKPMIISSGFRCANHPVEARKSTPGVHSKGLAADIAVQGQDAYKLLRLALEMGFSGIGVNQKGTGRFLHLDTMQTYPRPNIWSY